VKRVRLRGTVRVALPSAEAFALFTPRGEQAWAEGWAPVFPAETVDDAEPGTVFLTDHDRHQTLWVVASCEPGRAISYARVTPGKRAGLVTVTCEGEGDGTSATVEYDLTALSAEADAQLDTFAAHYDEFLAHWQEAIDEVTAAPPASRSAG
jgi:hypothetical protein